MKKHHQASARTHARAVLAACSIAVGQNFYTLRSSQVEALLEHADRDKYQKPRSANASRGRYYHERMQRHAQLKV